MVMYEIVKEISEWAGDYSNCNHTYLLDNNSKIIAYEKCNSKEIIKLKTPLKIDKRYRKFIRVNHDGLSQFIPKEKDNNLRIFNVKSKDKTYTVTFDIQKSRMYCTCTGFSFRGKCKHADAVKSKL
jgi:hypothetical protein